MKARKQERGTKKGQKKNITRATVDKHAKPRKEVNRERKIYEKKVGREKADERRMKGEGEEWGLCNLY